MVTTSFSVDNAGSLAATLADISTGTDAAPDTAYVINLTAAISALSTPPPPSLSVSLRAGSSLTLQSQDALIVTDFGISGTVTFDLVYTGLVTLDDGTFVNDPVALTDGATTAGLFTGAVLGTTGDGGDTVRNSGTIQYGGTYAAVELDSGTVQNGWNGPATALISGAAVGVQANTTGLVQNGGTITASGAASTGVYLAAGTVDNGQLSDITALITGGRNGVEIAGAGVVVNDGTIGGTASDGVYLGSGSLDNGAPGDTAATILGGPNDSGVLIEASGTVVNDGTIIGGAAAGARLFGGGTLDNGVAAALIEGNSYGALLDQAGTLANSGTIAALGGGSAAQSIGAFLANGGTLENLRTAAVISGPDYGVAVIGAAGVVTNQGTILGTDASSDGVVLSAGGSLTNSGAGALISGAFDGVGIAGATAGDSAMVQNSGTINGLYGVDFLDAGNAVAGTLVNSGLIAGNPAQGGYAVLFGVGDERLVLQAGGRFTGAVLGFDDGATNSTALELAAGTAGTLSALAANAGTVADSDGSFGFSGIGTITVDAGASWTIAAPGQAGSVDIAGTLAVTGGAVEVTGALTNSGTILIDPSSLTVDGAVGAGGGSGTILLATGSTLTLAGSVAASEVLAFGAGGTAETEAFGTPGAVQATITGFVHGDTIDLLHTAVTGFQYANGTLDVLDNSTTVAVLALPGPYSTSDFAHAPDNGNGTFITTDTMPCFAAGTRLRTASGDVAVERLRVGDRVVALADGAATLQPIVWIGDRVLDLDAHPRRHLAAPVLIRRDALGPALPARDLRVSPDHCLLIDGRLIPAKLLVNGMTIVQQRRLARVHYFHVELPRHAVLLAENLPAESYLDTGNRATFGAQGLPVPLHPDLAGTPRLDGATGVPCAPLTVAPAAVAPVWRAIATRAAALGHARPPLPTTPDPALRLECGGARLPPVHAAAGRCVFALPNRAAEVRLVSRSFIAADMTPGLDDWRRLGVAVTRLRVIGAEVADIALDAPALGAGWHATETEEARRWRWTDGAARLCLPAPVPGGDAGRLLDVRLGAAPDYPLADDTAPEYCAVITDLQRRRG